MEQVLYSIKNLLGFFAVLFNQVFNLVKNKLGIPTRHTFFCEFTKFKLFLISVFLLNATIGFAQFSVGKGTKEDPYKISTWSELHSVRENITSSFILINNLDRNTEGYEQFASASANGGQGWLPIVNFSGIFDGNDFNISNLIINRPNQSSVGLFGKAGNAEFKNLHLKDVHVKASNDIGGLLGLGIKITISNCSFDGIVEGKYFVGGLVGTIGNSQFSDCYSLGQVTAFRSGGGIAGNAYQTNVNRCFSSGNVEATLEAGGLIGLFHSVSNNMIQNSYSLANVSADEVVGGLVGKLSNAQISHSYAAGELLGEFKVGGLVGLIEKNSAISDSFWDVEKTGQSSNSGGGNAVMTNILKQKDSWLSSNWDFFEIWGIVEPTESNALISYPFLKSITYDQLGAKESKNPIPGLELFRFPQGLDFPSEMEKSYGDPDYTLGPEVDAHGISISYFALDTSVVKITGNQAMILKAGITTIYAKAIGHSVYNTNIPLEQTLTVSPAVLRISSKTDQSKFFGTDDPMLEYILEGFQYDDGSEVITGDLIRELGEQVGFYEILIGSLAAGGNYEIEYHGSHFQIFKKKIVVEAIEKQKIYGQDDPQLSFLVSGINPDEISVVLSGSLMRESGEKIGKYQIGQGNLQTDFNYELVFKESFLEIIPAELSLIFNLSEIVTEWSKLPALPKFVSALTQDGQILELGVTWQTNQLNLMEVGTCLLYGSVGLPQGIVNTEMLKAAQPLKILAKPAPEDMLLSNNRFEPGSPKSIQEIGKLSVIDKADVIHTLSLVKGTLDNSLFVLNGNSLSWKNTGDSKFKNQYSILVEALDRAGNVIQKQFQLKSEFVRLGDIEVFNSFSPDQDGINDSWGVPALSGIEGVRIQIFERSGQLMHSTVNPSERWDGTFLGRPMPEGTYYWVLTLSKTGEVRRGFLNLFRN